MYLLAYTLAALLVFTNMVQVIALEGNIGSGKTSLCAELTKRLTTEAEVVCEPIKYWMDWNYNGQNFKMLKDIYESNDDLFDMQIFIQFSMLRTIWSAIEKAKIDNKKYVICERTLASSVAVFSQNSFDSKYLTNKQISILKFGLDTLRKLYPNAFIFDKVFYLYLSPNSCLERVRKRNRNDEDNIDLQYLTNLNIYYNHWFSIYFKPLTVNTCIKVNADNNISDLADNIIAML